MQGTCINPNCGRTGDCYPDGLCRECHEQAIRTGEKQDAKPRAKSYRSDMAEKSVTPVSRQLRPRKPYE